MKRSLDASSEAAQALVHLSSAGIAQAPSPAPAAPARPTSVHGSSAHHCFVFDAFDLSPREEDLKKVINHEKKKEFTRLIREGAVFRAGAVESHHQDG